jgi:hypothetical protein
VVLRVRHTAKFKGLSHDRVSPIWFILCDMVDFGRGVSFLRGFGSRRTGLAPKSERKAVEFRHDSISLG